MLWLILCYILLDGKYPTTSGLTCVDVVEKGSGSSFNSLDLSTLSSLTPDELKKCTVILGKDPLSNNQSYTIWKSYVDVYGGGENIPEVELQQMGWIINGIPAPQFYNLSYSDVDTIASFGRCTELSPSQLDSLKEAISDQWLGKELEDFTGYDLIALRQILCAYNGTSILSIHPDAYKDAATELALLTNCSQDVLKGLAKLAVDEQAFGDPKLWTSVQTGSVGCVLAGLPSIADVPAESFEGITANIIDCLPSEAFQRMTSQQVSRLTSSAARALSRRKIGSLSDEKQYAVDQADAAALESKAEILCAGGLFSVLIILLICIK